MRVLDMHMSIEPAPQDGFSLSSLMEETEPV